MRASRQQWISVFVSGKNPGSPHPQWRQRDARGVAATVGDLHEITDVMKKSSGQYSAIEAMDLLVVDQTKSTGGIVTVNTTASAPAPSLLGAACQELKIPVNKELGLYTAKNVMLADRLPISKTGLKSGDTVYLRKKARGDDLLFFFNWRVVAIGLLLLSILGLVLVSALYALTAGRTPFVYGVVIDAGSSHSEATLYHWAGSKLYGTGKAEQVAHEEVDASGISDLKPRQVQQTIEKLLDSVKAHIPAREVPRTPVYLAATAGMRLLNITDPVRTDLTFLAAETAIKGSGMKFGGAGILSGPDEGLSAWLSANYLLDRLPKDHSDAQRLVGAMDCGGASTQIAFEVPLTSNDAEFKKLKLYGHPYNVFSRTYLCYGVNEAYNRYLMIQLIEQKYNTQAPIESPCHNKGFDKTMPLRKLVTPCTIHKELPQNLRNSSAEIRIIGSGEPEICTQLVANLFPEKSCNNRGFGECFRKINVAIPDIDFTALSSFYYTIKELKFKGSDFTELRKSTTDLCKTPYDELEQKLYGGNAKYATPGCFKANYIPNLLTNYGISDSNLKSVTFKKEAKGYNLGWSLGYMINATNAIPEAASEPGLIPLPMFVFCILVFSVILCIGLFSCLLSKRRAARLQDQGATTKSANSNTADTAA